MACKVCDTKAPTAPEIKTIQFGVRTSKSCSAMVAFEATRTGTGHSLASHTGQAGHGGGVGAGPTFGKANTASQLAVNDATAATGQSPVMGI